MSRERIVAPQEQRDEEKLFPPLRPQRLDEYIGQSRLVEVLRIGIDAAKQRGDALDHVLFHGPPGLGKTTLAHIIANELGAEIHTTSGPALERPGDLMAFLVNLGERDVLFIDEIHRVPRPVEEFLYSAMENFSVNFTLDKGIYTKPLPFKLERFTLVGATTRAGMLTAPLRERFGIRLHLDFYIEEELKQIVKRSANILGIELVEQGAAELARRSRGTPRIVNRLLARARDYAQARAEGKISREVAKQALHLEGIDEEGLDKLDRAFLKTIIETYDGGPVGLQALGATLNEEVDTLEDMVEPFLLRLGYVARTPSGRRATQRAFEHLGYPVPKSAPGQLRLLEGAQGDPTIVGTEDPNPA